MTCIESSLNNAFSLQFISDEQAPKATIKFNLDTFHTSVIQEELNFWIQEVQQFLPATGSKPLSVASPRLVYRKGVKRDNYVKSSSCPSSFEIPVN